VGTKKDLRTDTNISSREGFITADTGRKVAADLKLYAYMECSSKNNDGVRAVFETAARVALSKELKGRKCNIL